MSGYAHLSIETVADYLASTPEVRDLVDTSALVDIREVGDGNLNLVFIITDAAGRGVVLKQSLPYVRLVGPVWPMTPERARREAHANRAHARFAPSAVPHVHHFDTERYIITMEDLSDHTVWRTALNSGLRHDGAAEALGDYIARIAFGTSVLGAADPEAHKLRVAAAINPELCTITEDLVFTEPWVDAGRNSVLPDNAVDARAVADDAFMVARIGMAKWTFMTRAEALIHGDLHTGSVMVRAGGDGRVDSVRAIDSEFAFYGPIAFDLGALWANYVIAAARAGALGEGARMRWCLNLISGTWHAFESTFRQQWPQRCDPRVFTDDVGERLLAQWQEEAWVFAAAKMTRRIIGLAKASDIETLDPQVRVGAARAVLRTAALAVRECCADADPDRLIGLAGEQIAAHT